MLLKFHADAYYNGELVFQAGKTYEVTEERDYANRWIRRGLATKVDKIPEPVIPKPHKPSGKNKAKAIVVDKVVDTDTIDL